MALIGLHDIRFTAFHGFYEEEQLAGGEYAIDLLVDTATEGAAAQDDLFQTVNYEVLFTFCQSEMKKPSRLIETVAQRILQRIVGHFGDQVAGVRIVLRKFHPLPGDRVGYASIELAHGSLEDQSEQMMKSLFSGLLKGE